jgi:hypothetical protein
MVVELKTTTVVDDLGTEVYKIAADDAEIVSRTKKSSTRYVLTNGDIGFTVDIDSSSDIGFVGLVVSQDKMRIVATSLVFSGSATLEGIPTSIVSAEEITAATNALLPFVEDAL